MVACIYAVMEKCKGVLTPELLNIFTKQFMTPNLLESMIPSCLPLRALPFELLGLLSCSTLHNNKTPMNTMVKHSYMRALPSKNGH